MAYCEDRLKIFKKFFCLLHIDEKNTNIISKYTIRYMILTKIMQSFLKYIQTGTLYFQY